MPVRKNGRDEEKRESRIKSYSPFAFKFYMEQHIENVMKTYQQKLNRRLQLEQEMSKVRMNTSYLQNTYMMHTYLMHQGPYYTPHVKGVHCMLPLLSTYPATCRLMEVKQGNECRENIPGRVEL